MGNFSRYEIVGIHMPRHPLIRKVVSIPDKRIYINMSAAPEANIIRLVQAGEYNLFCIT